MRFPDHDAPGPAAHAKANRSGVGEAQGAKHLEKNGRGRPDSEDLPGAGSLLPDSIIQAL